MKKSILIISAVFTTVSLMACGYLQSKNTTLQSNEIVASNKEKGINTPEVNDFFYDIDSRFIITVTKEKLQNAKSILDFIPKIHTDPVVSYETVKVIILGDYHQTNIVEIGKNDVLTPKQLKLLQTVNYSSNILIRADFQQKNEVTGELEQNHFTPYITIVPEKEAEYINGKDVLINYLKTNSKENTSITEESILKSGKLYFTVTKNGAVSDVTLTNTSGYPSIDKKMVELINKMPGKWIPAENSKGEKVAQKLVFSFGIMGC